MAFNKKVKEVKEVTNAEAIVKNVVTNIPEITATNTKVAKRIKEGTTMTTKASEELVKKVMQCLRDELIEGGSVTLPGLGLLKVVDVPTREYKNRLTGDEKVYQVEAHKKITWKTTQSLKLS